jgi:hypothetical protein
MASLIYEILVNSVAKPIAKLLLKKYLHEDVVPAGEAITDIAKKRLDDVQDARELARHFESIADRVVARLVPIFGEDEQSKHMHVKSVARELAACLSANVSSELFVAHDLRQKKIEEHLRAAHRIPPGTLSRAERDLYDRALNVSVRYLNSSP